MLSIRKEFSGIAGIWQKHRKTCVLFGIAAMVLVIALSLIITISRALSGGLVLSPDYGPTTGGTSVTISHSTGEWNEQTIDFGFVATDQAFTAPVTGQYKLEVWGAQGGSAGSGEGGLGGYTVATVSLTAGQTIYIHTGGQGGSANIGGYNGGGTGTSNGNPPGGGGATHIATASGTLNTFNANRSAVLLVAGGGGGTMQGAAAGCNGGAGGGTTGGTGVCSGFTNATGGTQTAGGAGSGKGGSGTFGQGGNSSHQGGSQYSGGGGGGYFGGGAGDGKGGSAGGGSGYIAASATNGTTTSGINSGYGRARVTIMENGIYYKPKVYVDGVEVNANNVNFTPTDTANNEPGSVTFTTPAHASGTASVSLDFETGDDGEFNYWAPATSYTNECTVDGGQTWDTFQYIDSNTAVDCRIVLDGSYSGTISLIDDFYNTVNPALTGTFASTDSRYDPLTRTFTVTQADSVDSSGRTLNYTYTSPTWSTIDQYWESDGSNQDDLFWPLVEVTTNPDNPALDIVPTTDATFFGIYAEEFYIISQANNDTYCESCEATFTVSTHGAPYFGNITMGADLSNSSDPVGDPGVFSPAVLDFSNSHGSNLEFTYTPKTVATSPDSIALCGTSASPAITNDCIDIEVLSPTMHLTGPTVLSRGETGSYTLTVDIAPNFSGTVDLTDTIGILMANLVGGVFVDTSSGTNPTGTFNSTTNTYTFTAGGGETYERTFTYTMPSDAPSDMLTMRLTATADAQNFTYTNVNIRADKITFKCSASYPDCNIGYVGLLKDYNVRPNGVFDGSIALNSSAGGSFSGGTTMNWSGSSSLIRTSYIPASTGRHNINATVTNTTNSGMLNETYYSYDEDSLDDYIWVIANQMSIVGDAEIANAGSGHYTLILNGPYDGSVYLDDLMGGVDQNGTFSNGGVCELTFADYNVATNQTSCTFMYTPTIEANNRTITITPSMPSDYEYSMSSTPRDVLALGYPRIDTISPTSGPSTGGGDAIFTGINFNAISYVTFDGALCTNLNIVSDTLMVCRIPEHAAGAVDVVVNSNSSNKLTYTYFDLATDYVNECSVDDGVTWSESPYVDPGVSVPCRIVLDGRFQGTITLNDDYYDTISEDLYGSFASTDQRFYSDGSTNYFTVGYSDTANSSGQTLNYTYTSPSWATLKSYYQSDGSTDSDLFWPLLEVNAVASDGETLVSSESEVVFGLYAQEYYIYPDGDYSYYCVNCEVDFIISTYGAPYEGTITLYDDLSNSDDPQGANGTFWAVGEPGNPAPIDFSGSEGTDSSFSYTPQTSAEGTDTNIGLCGTSSVAPMIEEFCLEISPVIDPGIYITPQNGYSFLTRGETGTYTLSVTLGSDWSGEVALSDMFNIDSSNGNGVFADASSGSDPTGTFDSSTSTYTFTAGAGETYTRTFTYTLRDDSITGPAFPYHILQMFAESNSPNKETFTNIFINANGMNIKCSTSYPDCNITHVGRSQDYSFTPSGAMMGEATVSVSSFGEIGELVWPTIAGSTQTLAYSPKTPGRKVMTAYVTSSNIASMVGQSYDSTNENSLNDYIWVMANEMNLTGPDSLKSGATGDYTLTMNGPFIGDITISDLANNNPADGTFSNGGVCSFDLEMYDPVTNTTTCNFTYTPYLFEDRTMVNLTPNLDPDYEYPVVNNTKDINVYGVPIITSISPESGPTTGGNIITLIGNSIAHAESIYIGNIPINLSNVTVIDDDTISFAAPANAAGVVNIVVKSGGREYDHPGIYTYMPSLSSISPENGPTTGGTGFGVEYDAEGTATITGQGLMPVAQYSDGVNQYTALSHLEFNGNQYIDTGVNQLGNTKMTVDILRTGGIYAAGVLSYGNYFMFTLAESFPVTANYGDVSRNAGSIVNAVDSGTVILDANGTDATLTVSAGSITDTNTLSPNAGPSVPYNIYLGAANNGAGATSGIEGSVYGMQIDKDGVNDDRNFIPVCSTSGVGGMFDTLHNVFYPSASSTPFTCDYSDIEPPTILFGDTEVPAENITIVDSSTLLVVPPARDEGVVDVDVIVNGVTVTLDDAYEYFSPLEITAIDPFYGPIAGGTTITIYGKGFLLPNVEDSDIIVTFDEDDTPVGCTVTSVTTNEITCTTGAHDPGLVSVTVSNGVESAKMDAVVDPDGDGGPTTDDLGRSTGGFLYDDTYIEISTVANQVNLSISISSPFDEESTQVGVTTNNARGYSLSMKSNGANLVCSTNSSQVIPSTIGNEIDQGSWGYQVGTTIVSNNWATAPLVDYVIDTSNTPTFVSPNPAAGRNTQINFAARDGQPRPISPCSGYVQTMVYTAVANL